jgi:hypothetical protein
MNQLNLFSAHLMDNNPESTATLTINRKSFEGQNKRLFDLLMQGHILSFSDAYIKHGISDVRRRAKDLKDIGKFELSCEFIPGTRNKVWFMTDEQKIVNNLLLRN